jgi:GTP cyclohydrolase I
MTATLTGIEAVRSIIAMVEDPLRDGLVQTPMRFLKALEELTNGYELDADDVLSTQFPIEQVDQMVAVTDIEFTSLCEHHLFPFMGVAHVAYLPRHYVVGLSKIPRLVECFAHRLQLQERLAQQVADTMMRVISPQGAGVVIRAAHLCMGCRGVRQRDARMTTSVMLGNFRTNPAVRGEFLQLLAERRRSDRATD